MRMPGSLGILKTNKIIIDDAIKNNYKTILILQDDIILAKDFYPKFRAALSSIMNHNPDYKLIFLGAMQHKWNNIIVPSISQPWYNCYTSAEGAFSVIIKNTCFQEMLEFITNYIMPIDSGALSFIQDKYPDDCYVIYPNIIISDIRDSDLRLARNIENSIFRWNPNDYDFITNYARS